MVSLVRYITDELSSLYDRNEARAMTMLLLSHLWPGTSDAQLLLMELDECAMQTVTPYVRRLANGEPIQYVTGRTDFYGLDIHVEPGVLIPRPETEMLIDILNRQARWTDGYRCLDIGTGSGCIAVALKSMHVESIVEAWDISDTALGIASENAHRHNLNIDFRRVDILNWLPTDENIRPYNLVVSNPPYIPEEERCGMDRNVLDYEPSEALFVPDTDPLLFYRIIAGMAAWLLSEGGMLAFEINPRFVSELTDMLVKSGFEDVVCWDDQFGKKRFITAIWRDQKGV